MIKAYEELNFRRCASEIFSQGFAVLIFSYFSIKRKVQELIFMHQKFGYTPEASMDMYSILKKIK